MQIIFLLTLLFLLGGANTIIEKRIQLSISQTVLHFAYYILVNSIFACIYFGVAGKLQIHINIPTFIYAVLYAVIVSVSLIAQICILSYVSISTSSIISFSGSLILSSVFGILYFNEAASINLATAVFFIILSVFLSVGFNFSKDSIRKNKGMQTAVLCIISFLNSGCANILPKLYAESKVVSNVISFFFLTNLMLAVTALIVLTVCKIKNKYSFKKIINIFSKKQIGFVATCTAVNNISSVLSVVVLSKMDISLYTIIMSSLGIIRSGLVSIFFREKMGIKQWLAVAFSVIAIIIINI